MSLNIKYNTKYQIETKEGYKNFDGVSKTNEKQSLIKITTANNFSIIVTPFHRFVVDGVTIIAKDVIIGTYLETIHGLSKTVKIDKQKIKAVVYDLLEVKSSNNSFYANGIVNHNCEFMGSSTTLLPGSVLKKLSVHEPVQRNEYIKQYDLPVYNKSTPDNNHIYFMVCDVSRGKGLDYSTFSIFDISTVPYVQVCTYRCNTTTPTDFATIIFNMGKLYNEAYVMIELNDLGEQVATILKYDLDYDNVICMQSAGRAGKRISSGFGKGIEYGIRTTTAVKRLGCSMTKLLLEQNKLVLKDLVTIKEFATFAKDSKESYSAQAGFHDDMVMTVILFAFITQDPFFIGFTDINVMNLLRDQTNLEIEEDLMPFGVVTNPLDSLEPVYIKFAGESGVWTESTSGGDIW